MAGLDPLTVAKMLEVLSPVRPAQLRMSSGLGNLAATLRGGTQPANQLLTQLASRPGVQKGALSRVFGHVDPTQKMSPMELSGQARSPKLYTQRGISDALDDGAVHELATDLIYSRYFVPQRAEELRSLLEDVSEYGLDQNLADTLARNLTATMGLGDLRGAESAVGAAESFLGREVDLFDVYLNSPMFDDAWDMAKTQSGGKSMVPAYQGYQRQDVPGPRDTQGGQYFGPSPNYFETVLRGAPSLGRRGSEGGVNAGVMQPDESFHFSNPSQLGHVRGSVTPEGRVFAEELQSDPLEVANAAQLPELSSIYGKLGRMLIDRSAEAGAPSVSFPSAERIASVRNKSQLPFFKSVYDKDLDKQLYRPLQERGVPLTQDDGWTTMALPPDLVEAIRGGKLLDYKTGGTVAPQQPWWRSAKGGLSKVTK